MTALESAAIAAWYSSRPEIRRLLAIRDQEGLRVLVQLDPAPDSNETHPAWMANRDEWTEELQWRTGAAVRLERFNESDDDETDPREVVVADLSWRDPSFVRLTVTV